ncbi:hypothetical protein TNCV_2991901 [Trichonephila clavipes]|nr:hypothetical protein TNCV_2991901 [Trichonephila clavipes]
MKLSPVAESLMHRASTPQVRGSNPGLGKVDSSPQWVDKMSTKFSWELNTEGFVSGRPPDRNICSCT